jgi:hypothetical protein
MPRGVFAAQPTDIEREPLVGNLDANLVKALVDRGQGMTDGKGGIDFRPRPTDPAHLSGRFFCA